MSVIRYNDFDGTEYTSYNFVPFDSHGSQLYYTGSGDFRGQPIIEVYNNTFRYHHTYLIANFRGGSILFHDNVFTYIAYSNEEIGATEEEGWQPAFFSPLRTVWPAEDQITNSFFWNNTLNGNPMTDILLLQASDAIFIQKDRDYFMHAPQSTGGKSTYPTRAGADDMTFSSSGANAYYPYTPFTYPHPLQADGVAPEPERPTGLRIK